MAGRSEQATRTAIPAPARRSSAGPIIAGLLAYALVKLAGIGIVTGVGPMEVAANPDLFLPAAGSRVLSELFGAGLLLLLVVGFTRVSPRSGFLGVAIVQSAIAWLTPFELRDTWMRWMFGATGLDQAWKWAGLNPPFQEHSVMGGLSVPDLLCAAAAGAIAQTVHNMAAGQAAREA
jgi:hypothetical protein